MACLSTNNFAYEEEKEEEEKGEEENSHVFDNALNKHAFNRNKKIEKEELLPKSKMEKIVWL